MGTSDKISNIIKILTIVFIAGLLIAGGAFLIKSHIIFLIGSFLSGGAFFLAMCTISLALTMNSMKSDSQ